jgi:hypothetical protein
MKRIILFSALLAIAFTAHALTLKEKQQLATWQESLNKPGEGYGQLFKDKCGYDLPISIDEKMTTPFIAARANAASYCDSVREAIADMCSDNIAKDAIKSKVKKLSCTSGAKDDDANLKLNNGTLTFAVGHNASNIGDKVKKFLEDNL